MENFVSTAWQTAISESDSAILMKMTPDDVKQVNIIASESNISDYTPQQTHCLLQKCGMIDKYASNTQEKIARVCDSIKSVLLEKNRRYGDSALKPKNIFSKQNAGESILIRLDDKISRIMNSTEIRKNDVFDLLGYLALYSVSQDWNFEDMID